MKKRVSSTVTKRKPNPRPRKYASASERQAAYRARAPEVCFRAEPKTVETLDRIAETLDQSRADVLLSMTKFALANHDWARFGLTHKPLPFEYGVNPLKTEILERAKLPNGTLVRLQKRGKAYDVITNSTGITWRYLEKAVSEERARNAFDLYTMQRKENPMKTTRAKRKPTPAQLAARERFAEMARSGAFKKAGGRKANPATTGGTWLVHLVGKPQSWYATKGSKSAAVRLANMLNRQEGRIKYEVSEADWSRKTNPARKAAGVRRNPAAKGMTFYVHANLGYGKSAHFKVTASPGANSARSAANEVAAHLGYPVFVGSRNERPVDGYPVIRYEFVDDAQTKAVDLFVYQVKREGVKYSTIRKTNPVKYRDIAKGVPPARVQYAVHMPDRPSYHAMAYFTKKADAVETAQEVSDRTGKPIAVTRVQVHFGPL